MIPVPCHTCNHHHHCREERDMKLKSLFSWARDEEEPVCSEYTETSWHGVPGVAA